jgi:hypothetical protein
MLRVVFEPMIQMFERAKTVDALDRAAIVIDIHYCIVLKFKFYNEELHHL